MNYLTLGFGALLLVIVTLLFIGNRRSTGDVVLPARQAEGGGREDEADRHWLSVVEITPETVKPAVNTLARPVSYSRTQVVETF